MEAWVKMNWPFVGVSVVLVFLAVAFVVAATVLPEKTVPGYERISCELPVKVEMPSIGQCNVRLPDGKCYWGYGTLPPQSEEIWYLGNGWFTFELEGQRFLGSVTRSVAPFPK